MECSKPVINRVKRTQGQIKGVIQMMESSMHECKDIVTQLKAIRSSIDKTIALLTTTNLVNAIEEKYQIKLEALESEIELILKGE